MRILATIITALCLWTNAANAAMFGDFAIPDSLSPVVHQTNAHNNRTAVVVYTQSNGYIVLYLPTQVETTSAGQTLEIIGQSLQAGEEAYAFNLGGRPWFGSRATTNGVSFYDGYTYRNGVLYPVAFSLADTNPISPEILQVLSKVWLIQDIAQSPANSLLVLAMEQFDNGDMDAAVSTLIQAEYFDSGNWFGHFLRGRIEEERELFTNARDRYQSAFSLYPYDLENVARYYAMQALTVDADKGVNSLSTLATDNPDESTIWEQLAKVYLASDMNEVARDYFEEALAINPTSEAALYNLSFIYAQEGNYEDAFRRSREFYYYRPWLPHGIVPDVSTAPGMGAAKVNELLSEALPLGYVGNYAGSGSTLATLSSDQVQQAYASYVVYSAPPTYQVVESYAPVISFIWNWSTKHREPWRPGTNWSRPPNNRPGQHRPKPPGISRPPERPGIRPPIGSIRPPHGSGGSRPGESRPPQGRPPQQPGNMPPTGQPGNRPPSPGQGNNRPPGNSGIITLPAPVPERPQPGNRPETQPTPAPEQRPQTPPQPSRPTPQPEQRPQPGNRPQTRPAPVPERKPEARPAPQPERRNSDETPDQNRGDRRRR
jgi:Tfp pilus assembly protein PilF